MYEIIFLCWFNQDMEYLTVEGNANGYHLINQSTQVSVVGEVTLDNGELVRFCEYLEDNVRGKNNGTRN